MKRYIRRLGASGIAIASMLHVATANAALCAGQIAEFRGSLPHDGNGEPTFVGTARQSIAAQLEHQPTRESVGTRQEGEPGSNISDSGAGRSVGFGRQAEGMLGCVRQGEADAGSFQWQMKQIPDGSYRIEASYLAGSVAAISQRRPTGPIQINEIVRRGPSHGKIAGNGVRECAPWLGLPPTSIDHSHQNLFAGNKHTAKESPR